MNESNEYCVFMDSLKLVHNHQIRVPLLFFLSLFFAQHSSTFHRFFFFELKQNRVFYVILWFSLKNIDNIKYTHVNGWVWILIWIFLACHEFGRVIQIIAMKIAMCSMMMVCNLSTYFLILFNRLTRIHHAWPKMFGSNAPFIQNDT